MNTNTIPELASLSFWRVVDIPFGTYVAMIDRWLPGGELRLGRNQLTAPADEQRDPGTYRIQVRLARGPLQPLLPMRLDIDLWSAESTALELIPGRLVRPTAEYFRAGNLLLDALTRSRPQRPEPRAGSLVLS